MAKKVWVVIAAYNEEKHIGAVIDNVKKFCSNIIVVDDGSRDKTFQIAKSNGVILHSKKLLVQLFWLMQTASMTQKTFQVF